MRGVRVKESAKVDEQDKVKHAKEDAGAERLVWRYQGTHQFLCSKSRARGLEEICE